MVDETAKGHPLYDKTYNTLRRYSRRAYAEARNLSVDDALDDFETASYGKLVVDQIMAELEYTSRK